MTSFWKTCFIYCLLVVLYSVAVNIRIVNTRIVSRLFVRDGYLLYTRQTSKLVTSHYWGITKYAEKISFLR